MISCAIRCIPTRVRCWPPSPTRTPENARLFREVPPGEPPSLVNPPSGCRFHPRCTHFMQNLCEVESPPDFEPQPQHQAGCWLYQESTAAN